MIFDEDILAALVRQIRNDEIIELRALAAIRRAFVILPNYGLFDYLHILVKNSIMSPSQEERDNVMNTLKNKINEMISFIVEAEKYSVLAGTCSLPLLNLPPAEAVVPLSVKVYPFPEESLLLTWATPVEDSSIFQ